MLQVSIREAGILVEELLGGKMRNFVLPLGFAGCISVALLSAVGSVEGALPDDAEILDPGAPWPKYLVERLVPPDDAGNGDVTAVALADLDGDRLPEVLVAWADDDGGVLVAYRYVQRRGRSESTHALLSRQVLATAPAQILHVTAADMDWNGSVDVVMALRGRRRLDWFPVTSDTPTEEFEAVPLPGTVTTLTSLDYGRRDTVPTPVVGVLTATGPHLVLFPEQRSPINQSPVLVPISGSARSVATGNLDEDAWWDVVVATDGGVDVLAGTDSASRVEAREIKVSTTLAAGGGRAAIALDRFERSTTHRLAVAQSNWISLVDPKTKRWTAPLLEHGAAGPPDWVRTTWNGVGRGPTLVVPDSTGIKLYGALTRADDGWSASESTVLDLGAEPRFVDSGRISRDAVEDMVVVLEGSANPVLLVAAPRITFGVTTADDHDDGTCDSDCTLREAINAANANPGPDSIDLVPGFTPNFYPNDQLPAATETTWFNLALTGSGAWFIFGSSCTGGCNGLVFEGDVCSLESVHIREFKKNPAGDLGNGLVISGSHHPWVARSTANHNQGSGIHLSDTTDASISADFNYNRNHGIHIEHGPLAISSNNHVPSFRSDNNGGFGMRIDNVPDTMVGGTGSGSFATADDNNEAAVWVGGTATTGTHIAKLQASGNAHHGVTLESAGAVTLGVPIVGAESRLDSSAGNGVSIRSSITAHQIVNCTIADNDQHGIALYGASNVTIGPDVLVFNNHRHGVMLTDNGTDESNTNTIQDCTIGDDPSTIFSGDGNSWFGIEIDGGSNNTIGSPGHGNSLESNGWGGIRIRDRHARGNTVAGNSIGPPVDEAGWKNHGPGVLVVDASANTIGGSPAASNTITFNDYDGIAINGNLTVRVNCRFNSIHGNGALGLDLGNDGWTAPDPGDVDEGPNDLMNQPLIIWAESCGGNTYVAGYRDSAAGSYAFDLYSNDACDPTEWGEGQTHIGSFEVSHTAAGRFNFSRLVPSDLAGQGITGMTTDTAGSSSEFSNCRVVTAGRAGDATADCAFAADDLSAIINVIDDATYVTPGNPDGDGNGVVESFDLLVVAVRSMY